jgi:uncharacterized protein (TIGR00369 family)
MTIPSPAEIQAIVRSGVPLAGEWEVEVLAAEGGVALLRLPAKPNLLRPGNTISGPALMGLADVAMWAALLSTTQGRDDSVTSTMTVNFLRPAGSGPVLAEARIVKRGKRMLFGEILIRPEGSDDLSVHITTSWAVIAPQRGQ